MKLINFYNLFIALAFALLSGGCSYHKDKSDSFDSIFVSTNLIESISYQEVKDKVFVPKCISCHGDSGGVNLENYANARSFLEQIKQSTLIEKRMPKNNLLNNSEYMILAAWIKAGGPDQPLNGGKVPPPTVEILKPEFNSIKKIIIDRKCLSCHSPNGEAPRVLLDTVKDMIDSPLEIVIPGNPDESGLVLTLDRESGMKPMPPIDSGIFPISKEELEVIKAWILKGAKD